MSQLVKVFATKADSLSSILGSHIVDGNNLLLKIMFWPPIVCTSAHTHAHMHMQNKQINITNCLYGISQCVGGLVIGIKMKGKLGIYKEKSV